MLDREPYRYQAFLSDIAGQDIAAHGGEPVRAIGAVREFWILGNAGGHCQAARRLPGASPSSVPHCRASSPTCGWAGTGLTTFSDYANIASTSLSARVSA